MGPYLNHQELRKSCLCLLCCQSSKTQADVRGLVCKITLSCVQALIWLWKLYWGIKPNHCFWLYQNSDMDVPCAHICFVFVLFFLCVCSYLTCGVALKLRHFWASPSLQNTAEMAQFLDMHLKEACTDFTVSRLIGGPRPDLFPCAFHHRPRDRCRVVSRPQRQQILE